MSPEGAPHVGVHKVRLRNEIDRFNSITNNMQGVVMLASLKARFVRSTSRGLSSTTRISTESLHHRRHSLFRKDLKPKAAMPLPVSRCYRPGIRAPRSDRKHRSMKAGAVGEFFLRDTSEARCVLMAVPNKLFKSIVAMNCRTS